MIYTLTLNPSIDYVLHINNFKKGKINRAVSSEVLYGGKGINTSVVLRNLGIHNIALGFVGGYIGQEFQRLLNNDSVDTDFVFLKNSNTRINVKIKAENETDINASGPNVSDDELEELFQKLENIKSGDYITLAGSVPESVPQDIYVQITKLLAQKNVNVIVDAEKNLLLDVLPYSPFLIKPNHHELGAIVGKELTTINDIISAAQHLHDKGAKNVFVSMAEKGGVLITEENLIYYASAPSGKVVNSTGAGDSVVAGFLAEFENSKNYKKAFIYGICAGSASAFSEKLATKEEIEELFESYNFSSIKTF